MNTERGRREIQEAIRAGEAALRSLRTAQEKLSSARNWGVADLLGGGLFTSLIKHSRMDEAQACLDEARERLRRFRKELGDIGELPGEIRMEVSDFLSFADFFFDGIVADYLVQAKINQARSQVADAINQVEQILKGLRSM